MSEFPFSKEEWETCMKVLTALKDDPFNNPDNLSFKTLITAIHKKAKKEIRRAENDLESSEDKQKIEQTTIITNAQQNKTLYTHEKNNIDTQYTSLNNVMKCYACNSNYQLLHSFYHRLCPNCAELNYHFRQLEVDFSDHQVLITGGRVKIGYAAALKFLKSGAKVLLTTRFPALALEQFSQEKDFEKWQDKLIIYGLDLRNIRDVYEFITYCKANLISLDILINNAAQTIKYTADYYQPLILQEKQKLLNHQPHNLFANDTPIVLHQEQLLCPHSQ